MRRAIANPALTAMVLLLAAPACSVDPAGLRQKALQAEVEARRAFERHDPEAAERAANQAEDAVARLEKLGKSAPSPTPQVGTFLEEARAAAGSARLYAQLADEERRCRERLATLKLRAYRSARAAFCSYGFGGLASAAERFGGAGTNSLSPLEQQAARLAWSVMSLVEAPPPTTNGIPDWGRVGADLRAWSERPPSGVGLFLAASFALNGLTDFALSEIESVESSRLSTTHAKALYHLERSVLFLAHGWDKTATRELDQAFQFLPEGWNRLGSTQAVALIHFWQAAAALERKDLAQADRQLAAALKAWPESPVAPFIVSEKLAASGEWQHAAALLEERAAGAKDEWLARRLALRARELRSTKGTVSPLWRDPDFVVELLAHAFGDSLPDSAPSKWLRQFITDSKAFGQRLLEQMSSGDSGG